MRILVIRRDNIGDLVCTTPLIAALRQRYPKAEIGALVNSYNAEVLRGNPHLDHCFIYKKLKHVGGVFGRVKALLERARLILLLRRWKPDITLLAKTGYDQHGLRFARQIGARQIIGFAGDSGQSRPDIVPRQRDYGHEAERLMDLLAPLFDPPAPSELVLVPNPKNLLLAKQAIEQNGTKLILGINISARLPSQQWSAQNFADVARNLEPYFRVVLFWSPGSIHNLMHPGDDEKAAAIVKSAAISDILCYPTQTLADLISGISCVDYFLTADGGAMHIAAACKKPIIALFGTASPEQWHPWGVPHHILSAASQDVRDITPSEVECAIQQLASVRASSYV